MQHRGPFVSEHGLEPHGITDAGTVFWHLSSARLYEEALRRDEAVLSRDGALVCRTGEHTGRSPTDRFLVEDAAGASPDPDIWWGANNQPISRRHFDALLAKVRRHCRGRDLFVFDGYAGAQPAQRMRVRVLTELAWHNLFARNMFIRERDGEALTRFAPEFTVVAIPSCQADPAVHGTASPTFILVDLARRMVLIGGTQYAGEIKKSIFSVMNYYLPRAGVLSMHCSANYGAGPEDVALFFGLSGTGKTTLSADPSRTLIGDDEHGWSEEGVFNIEGGCYAKVIRLSASGEPEIWAASHRFGTLLENVVCDPETRRLDLDDDSITENTRASYPLEHIGNADPDGRAGHPRNVVFLTCDAFGVLPPIVRLSEPQAMYHFLSGYTAKVAGTERGVTEPVATFSTCFAAPFIPLHPGIYAGMLGERIRRHQTPVWLINTGWTGGPHGVGRRIELALTRRMVAAALSGELAGVETAAEPVFGLAIPAAVPGVPGELLRPWETWQSEGDYRRKARQLADMFVENFKQFESGVPDEVLAAGPPPVKA
jgi:phosphoenolpyruvate carboxykinase (ATP)